VKGLPLVLCAVLGAAAGGCKQDEDDAECVSNEQFFQERIWTPVMSQTCVSCHNASGAAKDSQFVLQQSDMPGYLDANLATVEKLAKIEYDGQPWLLAKPTAVIEHGGGEQFKPGSQEYDDFSELVDRIANPVTCDASDERLDSYWDGVQMLDDVETLRKASVALVGRLPTPREEQTVRDLGEVGLDEVLMEMMAEDAFYLRIIELFNDSLLTDRYLPGSDAIDLLDGEDYSNLYWFDNLPDDAQQNVARRSSNLAVARDALQLIAHVVREDRPFTEILTADYTMVNPFSAKSYGLTTKFDDETDVDEWREAALPGIPHAGILTSHMFMNRFPTTATNRNRHRSRMLYKFFLATDILALGERPVDATSIDGFNPTRENDTCTVCHTHIDPVAGALQNWDDRGRYRPLADGWYPEMYKPGFADAELTSSESTEGASWLGYKIVEDSRFGKSIVHLAFQGFTGQTPLREPTDPSDANYLGKLVAHDVQSMEFQDIAAKFSESDFDFKVLTAEIVKSPYFRAKSFVAAIDETEESSESTGGRASELHAVGTARFLTPEGLNRKITAVTGYPWRRNLEDQDLLLSFNQYRIFYGGIDSDSVIQRITDPNGIMVNVADRMSNEIACWNVPRDFTKSSSERVLFPFVETGYEPEDANGFEVPAVSESIRANIRFLHERLLGEFLAMNDPEIDRTYGLFVEVWRDGKKGLASEDYSRNLPGQCRAEEDFWTGEDLGQIAIDSDPNYTIRAWMAVLTYMLADYRFLHE